LLITVDLGGVEPIAGVSYSTAAGSAGIHWPIAVLVLVSDDDRTFHCAGELTELCALGSPAPRSGAHRYRTNRLATRGRYVRLAIKAPSYVFCDEIEVYRGNEELLKRPHTAPPVTNVEQLVSSDATQRGVRKRVLSDIAAMRPRVGESALSATDKKACLTELESLAERALGIEVPDEKAFRCVVPLNAVHAGVLALNAPILRASGIESFAVWHACRWDPVSLLDAPTAGAMRPIAMMLGEYRADTLNMTNPSDQAERVSISFDGLPGAPTPDWIELLEVLYTDTTYGRVIADVLQPLPRARQGWELVVPSGMTKQVWFRFHPTTAPGDYEGKVSVAASRTTRTVPIKIHIANLRFPKRVRCTQALWDYTDGPSYAFKTLGDAGMDAAIKNMQDHFVDQTWAHSGVAAMPSTSDFYNDKNELVKPLDWSRFDRWVQRWGGTPRYYAVFLSRKGKRFADAKMGTAAFDARVRVWAAAWREHVIQLGLDPSQIVALVVDEYSHDEQAAHILAWCKPIKAGFPEIQIFETVCQVRPDRSKVQELYNLIDIFCPPLPVYRQGGQPVREFYAKHVARGAKLWTYKNGLVETSDPYWHHRLQEWRCWANGMTGTGFWAYCDAGGDDGSWNPYIASSKQHYSPVHVGPGTIHDGKHWEAIREGVQDYEYLAMLRDRVKEARGRGRSDALLDRAEQLLAEAPKKVLEGDADIQMGVWWTHKDRTVADREIAAILELLEQFAARSDGKME